MLFVVVCVVVGWAMPHAQASSLIWRESGPDSGDELLFYESDGTYQVYNLPPDGSLPTPSLEGDDAGTGWDEVTAVDLDGDGQDEMLFYRQDGTFSFNEVNFDGSIGTTISAGSHYTSGWSAITAVDLDGDGQDEVFFYRDDGIYRFYDVRSNGSDWAAQARRPA